MFQPHPDGVNEDEPFSVVIVPPSTFCTDNDVPTDKPDDELLTPLLYKFPVAQGCDAQTGNHVLVSIMSFLDVLAALTCCATVGVGVVVCFAGILIGEKL